MLLFALCRVMYLFCNLSKPSAFSVVFSFWSFFKLLALVFHLTYFAALPAHSDQTCTISLFQTLCNAFITIYTQHSLFKYICERLSFQSTVQFHLFCDSVLSSLPQTQNSKLFKIVFPPTLPSTTLPSTTLPI